MPADFGSELFCFEIGIPEIVLEAGLGFLGITLDPARNAAAGGSGDDREISAPGAAVRTLVITAREDLQIAREVRSVLGGAPGG